MSELPDAIILQQHFNILIHGGVILKHGSLFLGLLLCCQLGLADTKYGNQNQIRVMTFNVQNLFDTEHDVGKNDYHFLPKNHPDKITGCSTLTGYRKTGCLNSDWTPEKLKTKLGQINKLIKKVGSLPDVLVVQEIENINVLKMLAQELGFKHSVLEEGFNSRGIDVGIMYNENNIEYVGHYPWIIKSEKTGNPTGRHLLGVYFKLKGDQEHKIFGVYGNHWPARMAPASARYRAAQNLKEFIDQDIRKFGRKNFHFVATGDFNSTNDDWPAPFRGLLHSQTWQDHLIDVRNLAYWAKNYGANQATYFYPGKMQWQYLDRILVSQNLNDGSGMEVLPKTYKVINNDFNSGEYVYSEKGDKWFGSKIVGTPKRWRPGVDDENLAGVSDHFPVEVSFSY